MQQYGTPPRLVRYWIPGVLLLLTGGSLLRILANRRAQVLQWIRELGQTTIDFWFNWVVEPTKRLVGTIRHDETSELAVMSKDSLRSDRESLERMVVDFAIANPENGSAYSDAQIAAIRLKVKQGDLSTVLRAYEKDIQSPVKGALLGNLAQALLIQVQKTKVDVEVAMNGIDEILKSQELLFGFVGVAPGMLITYIAFRWLSSSFGNRRGLRELQRQGEAVRLLRNIDRTLSNATPTENGMLSYKDHGLLLCEVHVLRQRTASLVPGRLQREFLEDIQDLLNIRHVEHKVNVLNRIQWAYGKWLI
ncbi:hypothetical protein BT93_L4469 [Corymbia citriodora subsp. variegata]|uniref:Uncharacterized protein n=1 Tax=Corymbia citriodora subsp. variegata TaxID=360336 RepID=A0A8T0CG29_CORYI|nr:hypothetical protein BT93_L4469 [Corymbia citriodora subsp. variegata]